MFILCNVDRISGVITDYRPNILFSMIAIGYVYTLHFANQSQSREDRDVILKIPIVYQVIIIYIIIHLY